MDSKGNFTSFELLWPYEEGENAHKLHCTSHVFSLLDFVYLAWSNLIEVNLQHTWEGHVFFALFPWYIDYDL